MAIIIKPFDFIPGTVIRSLEVNQDFDTIYTDYNGNITNANVAAGAAIALSKLAALPSAQIIVGSVGNVPTAVAMSGDGTISNTGVLSVTGSGGGPPGTFNNITLTGTTTLSGFTVGSVLFIGAAGVVTQDNASFFWDNTNNRLGIGTTLPVYDFDILKSVAAGTGVQAAVRNSNNASGAAHAIVQIQSGGGAGGDAYLNLNNNGITPWSVGLDNSDSDNFKISQSNSLGTNDRLTLRTNGEMLLPAVNPPTANYANQNSFAKSWGVIVGASGANNNSYNVLNTSRLAVGSYTLNFSTGIPTPIVTANVRTTSGVNAPFTVVYSTSGINDVNFLVYNRLGALVDLDFTFTVMGVQ